MFKVSEYTGITKSDAIRVRSIRALHIIVVLLLLLDFVLMICLWWVNKNKQWHLYILLIDLAFFASALLFGGCIASKCEHWILEQYRPDLPYVSFLQRLMGTIGVKPSSTMTGAMFITPILVSALGHAYLYFKKNPKKSNSKRRRSKRNKQNV